MGNNGHHRKSDKINIDYPVPDEKIRSGRYTFRIAVLIQGLTEVSIDGGTWQICRPAVGFWWFDWEDDAEKSEKQHRLRARVRTQEGKEVLSPIRYFQTVGRSKALPGTRKASVRAK